LSSQRVAPTRPPLLARVAAWREWLRPAPHRPTPPLLELAAPPEEQRRLKLGKRQKQVRKWVQTRRHKKCVEVKKTIATLQELDAFVPQFHHAPCILPPGTNY
jgi:hypothetical protein